MASNSAQDSEEDVKPDISLRCNTLSAGKGSAFAAYKPSILTNLQRGNTEATFCDKNITLSFHERAAQGEITEEQVKQEPNIDFLDEYEFTPLHWACSYGQISAVQLLVTAGADVNKLAPDLITPLLLAANGGHHEIVRLLLSLGAEVDHMDIIGNTALMYAAAGNHPHTTNELLGYQPKILLSNEDGDTAYSLSLKNNANLSQSVLEKYIDAMLSID